MTKQRVTAASASSPSLRRRRGPTRWRLVGGVWQCADCGWEPDDMSVSQHLGTERWRPEAHRLLYKLVTGVAI